MNSISSVFGCSLAFAAMCCASLTASADTLPAVWSTAILADGEAVTPTAAALSPDGSAIYVAGDGVITPILQRYSPQGALIWTRRLCVTQSAASHVQSIEASSADELVVVVSCSSGPPAAFRTSIIAMTPTNTIRWTSNSTPTSGTPPRGSFVLPASAGKRAALLVGESPDSVVLDATGNRTQSATLTAGAVFGGSSAYPALPRIRADGTAQMVMSYVGSVFGAPQFYAVGLKQIVTPEQPHSIIYPESALAAVVSIGDDLVACVNPAPFGTANSFVARTNESTGELWRVAIGQSFGCALLMRPGDPRIAVIERSIDATFPNHTDLRWVGLDGSPGSSASVPTASRVRAKSSDAVWFANGTTLWRADEASGAVSIYTLDTPFDLLDGPALILPVSKDMIVIAGRGSSVETPVIGYVSAVFTGILSDGFEETAAP